MNVPSLIDAIVRQTMVLVAQLATVAGGRAPVGHIADQVLRTLVDELQAQGLRQKVIADMLGMALRTYHRRVQQLSESATEPSRSLWEAVLTYLRERGVTGRGELLRRFSRDDDAVVRAVLSDLVASGLVFQSGRGDATVYRSATTEELSHVGEADPDALAALVWVVIHRYGPLGRDEIAEVARVPERLVDGVLRQLTDDGRVTRDTDGRLRSDACVIPLGSAIGWEAAVFDHYQAMVTSLVTKLRNGRKRATPDDRVGGSTYTFDLDASHPLMAEVVGLLSRVREQATDLRRRVEAEKGPPGAGPGESTRVLFYVGQTVVEDDAPEAAALPVEEEES